MINFADGKRPPPREPHSGDFSDEDLVVIAMDPAKFRSDHPKQYEQIYLAVNPLSPNYNEKVAERLGVIALGFGVSMLDILESANGEEHGTNPNDSWPDL
jgi:hypothetical protein